MSDYDYFFVPDGLVVVIALFIFSLLWLTGGLNELFRPTNREHHIAKGIAYLLLGLGLAWPLPVAIAELREYKKYVNPFLSDAQWMESVSWILRQRSDTDREYHEPCTYKFYGEECFKRIEAIKRDIAHHPVLSRNTKLLPIKLAHGTDDQGNRLFRVLIGKGLELKGLLATRPNEVQYLVVFEGVHLEAFDCYEKKDWEFTPFYRIRRRFNKDIKPTREVDKGACLEKEAYYVSIIELNSNRVVARNYWIVAWPGGGYKKDYALEKVTHQSKSKAFQYLYNETDSWLIHILR